MLTQDWDLGYRARSASSSMLDERIAAGEKLTADDLADDPARHRRRQRRARSLPVIAGTRPRRRRRARRRPARRLGRTTPTSTAPRPRTSPCSGATCSTTCSASLPDQTHPVGGDRWFSVVGSLLDEPDARWWTNEDEGVAGRDAMIAARARRGVERGIRPHGQRPRRLALGPAAHAHAHQPELRRVRHRPHRVAVQPRALRARRRLVDRQRHRLGRQRSGTASTGCRRCA